MASAWSKILEEIQTVQLEARREGTPLWYRGQRLASWPVKSTIHRHVDSVLRSLNEPLSEAQKLGLMRSTSKTLFHKFQSASWPLLDPRERSRWGVIFAMQHYGVPTRFIDWTETFVCALYFADRDKGRDDDAAIFVLKPEKLNRQTIGREGLVWLGEDIDIPTSVQTLPYHPAIISTQETANAQETAPVLEALAVAPLITNSRMVAQRASFTLSGDAFDPLEERYSGCITKIVLPASASRDIEDFLESAGVGHFSYFPDLGGLAQQLIHEMNRELEVATSLVAANLRIASER